MRRMVQIVVSLCVALLCVSCVEPGTYTPEFLTDNTLRMEVGKEDVLTYSPLTCQYAWNLERREFRLHTDTMSSYVLITLDEIPTEENQYVNASSLIWTSRTGADQIRKNIVLQVVKLEDDTIWLWNRAESIRMTLRFQ